jgi:hypothetical protein
MPIGEFRGCQNGGRIFFLNHIANIENIVFCRRFYIGRDEKSVALICPKSHMTTNPVETTRENKFKMMNAE